MRYTWRWFGPNDPIGVWEVRQAGAMELVSALHQTPIGEVWTHDDIMRHSQAMSGPQLDWRVVESVPIHESIKLGLPERDQYIENYGKTLLNLANCGIQTVCYNFMPVLDWTRTHLNQQLPDRSEVLSFSPVLIAAIDIKLARGNKAKKDYSEETVADALALTHPHSGYEAADYLPVVLAGLPGSEESYTLEDFKEKLAAYDGYTHQDLEQNLRYFLEAIMPFAEKAKINMALHPDDPPMDLFGLPRVVSNESDYTRIISEVDSPRNGITFCTGSLGVNPDNDLPGMVERLGHRIHFIHLRNIKRYENGNFHETHHLEGDVDMYEVIRQIHLLEKRTGRELPMRPDHGPLLIDDQHKKTNPGYSCIGRLKGLAELKGLEIGIVRTLNGGSAA